MLLMDINFYEAKVMSRQVKIVFLCFLLSVRIMLLCIIIEAALILILLASNTIELLNNTLSVLILDQIDNMGALLLFNYMRTNHNVVTTQDNFMQIRSSPSIEMFLYPAYALVLAFVTKIII